MKHILVAEFKLESNGFAKGETTIQDYKNRNLVFGDEIFSYFKGVKNEIGGFLDFFRDKEDVTLHPAVAANAIPGPRAAREVFDLVLEKILETYRSMEQADALLLSLHGAMLIAGEDGADGEGLLLEKLREVVGNEIPIFVTLDLHANISDKMAKYTNAMFVFDCYPHTDTYDRGLEAAEVLYRHLQGKADPKQAYQKVPIMCPTSPTANYPANVVLNKVHEIEARPGIISASVAYGFFFSDTEEMVMSAVAVADGDPELAKQTAAELADFLWNMRAEFFEPLTGLDEAVAMALAEEKGPFVLADGGDNPGGGSSSDGTRVLQALIDNDAQSVAFATIYDPETAAQAIAAGVGSTIHVRLGGKEYPALMGPPVECDAYVKLITDGVFVNKGPMANGVVNHLGPTVLLVIGGIEVIVTQTRFQPWDLNIFYAHGIDPKERKILVPKSYAHYRAHYGTIATNMVNVELPGLTAKDPRSFTYKNLSRPVYPYDFLEEEN